MNTGRDKLRTRRTWFILALILLVAISMIGCQKPEVVVEERRKSASDFGPFDFACLITDTYPESGKVLSELDKTFKASDDLYAKGDIILLRSRITDKGNLYKAASFYHDCFKHADTSLEKAIALLSAYSIEKLYGREEGRARAIEQAKGFKAWYGEAIEGKVDFSKEDIPMVWAQNKPSSITIGSSSILIKKGDVVKCQSERVVRDWLSLYNLDLAPWEIQKKRIVPWHEGSRIKELVDFADVEVLPVVGTLVKKRGDKWYAPDMEGRFKFEICLDKVYNYPTNLTLSHLKNKQAFQAHTSLKGTFQLKNLPSPFKLP